MPANKPVAASNDKNIIVTDARGKRRRCRPSELEWYAQRGWKKAAKPAL